MVKLHATKPEKIPSRARTAPLALLVLLPLLALLGSCARPPPADVNNACAMLQERKEWYYATIRTEERWGIPPALVLAFIDRESSFNARAKTERTKLFGFIPWKRKTSAFGYSQAIDASWKQYKKETGKKFAPRSNFGSAADFIGWYNRKSITTLGLSPKDAYNLYLAYHEGWSGYRKKNHMKKPWLIEIAKKVQLRANAYDRQLQSCADRLKVPWYRLLNASTGNHVQPG